MPRRVRLSPEGRREVIIKAAIALTREADGCLDSWSRQDVANKCVLPTKIGRASYRERVYDRV